MSSEGTEKTAGRAAARKAEEADRHGAAGFFLPAPDRTGTADVRAGVSVAVRFHNEQPGAVRLSAAAVSGRRGLHQLEGAAILSNAGALPQPSFVYAAVFYGVLIILAGQLLVGVPAAWGFAVYRFRGKKLFFTIYIVFMLLPFQVTMLSQYLVLDRVGVMNTHWAVILPAVFSTFPVFLIYRGFCTIPSGLLEAGRIDGAGEWRLFWQIGLPLASGGILSAMVLGFLEYWNMIEQPLAFLKDKSLWPLSLYLPEISQNRAGFAFAASVVTLVPSVFVFLLGQDYLEQGIVASALKE